MPSIVITGATSFIGRQLCLSFLQRGWHVFAVHRRNTQLLPDGVIPIQLDLHEYGKLAELVPECDAAMLLAWPGTRGKQRDDEFLQNDAFLSNLACVKALIATGCKTIALAGSQAEYGIQTAAVPINEDDPLQPITAYGRAKKNLFEYASALCKEGEVRLLESRFFSVYGPGDYEGTLVISVLKKMLQNLPCELTECKQMWDFLYVEDASEMVAKLIVSDALAGAYNIGSGRPQTLRQYVEEMGVVAGSNSKLLFGSIPYQDAIVPNIYPDTSKLTDAIGKPSIRPFKEGVLSTISWLLRRGKASNYL
mgnify:CR=1 FL=1